MGARPAFVFALALASVFSFTAFRTRRWSDALARAEGPQDGFVRWNQFSGRRFRKFKKPGGGASARSRRRRAAGHSRTRRAAGANVPFQRIDRGDDGVTAIYGFENFDRRPLGIKVEVPYKDVSDSLVEFGYSDKDLDAIDAWFKRTQKRAIAKANAQMRSGRVSGTNRAALDAEISRIKARNKRVQTGLEIVLDDVQKQYERRRKKLYFDRGYRFSRDGKLAVDIPKMVSRNKKRMRRVAAEIYKIAKAQGYKAPETIGAVTALVQTAIHYKIPPDDLNGRYITGVLPPPKSFMEGWGDCDTKTALLASILSNWSRIDIIGVAIPKHYLMGVHQVPKRGDVYIEFQGKPYILVEPSGPAWLPPGQVGGTTLKFLRTGRSFEIERLGNS